MESSLSIEGLEGSSGRKAGHEPELHSSSLESQQYSKAASKERR